MDHVLENKFLNKEAMSMQALDERNDNGVELVGQSKE